MSLTSACMNDDLELFKMITYNMTCDDINKSYEYHNWLYQKSNYWNILQTVCICASVKIAR